jgi:hypothetical protein
MGLLFKLEGELVEAPDQEALEKNDDQDDDDRRKVDPQVPEGRNRRTR